MGKYKDLLERFKNRKWDDLSDSEKKEWESFAENKQDKLSAWARLTHIKGCGHCKKFKEPLIKPMPYDYETSFNDRLNAKWLWHSYSVHGVPIEENLRIIGDVLGVKMYLR